MGLTREEQWYWLTTIRGIGPKRIEALLTQFGDVEAIYAANSSLLAKVPGIPLAQLYEIVQSRDEVLIKKNYEHVMERGVNILTPYEGVYPERLRNIPDTPPILYQLGTLPNENSLHIGIVGSRNCSAYGREIALYFARELAKEGVQIISGLARGIDEYGHIGALEAEGYTLGVLGSGIDYCYPQENINLYMKMEKQGGILSEHGLGVLPIAGNFPKRNRIISGLSDGVLVVEAKERSGSLITVDLALEQGKDVFVIPGRITDKLSRGCNNLWKMGAQVVTAPSEILDVMGYGERKLSKSVTIYKNISYEEQLILGHLSQDPKHMNELIRLTGLAAPMFMSTIVGLQMKNLAKECIMNYYVIVK